jgi:hypothetical protein
MAKNKSYNHIVCDCIRKITADIEGATFLQNKQDNNKYGRRKGWVERGVLWILRSYRAVLCILLQSDR